MGMPAFDRVVYLIFCGCWVGWATGTGVGTLPSAFIEPSPMAWVSQGYICPSTRPCSTRVSCIIDFSLLYPPPPNLRENPGVPFLWPTTPRVLEPTVTPKPRGVAPSPSRSLPTFPSHPPEPSPVLDPCSTVQLGSWPKRPSLPLPTSRTAP